MPKSAAGKIGLIGSILAVCALLLAGLRYIVTSSQADIRVEVRYLCACDADKEARIRAVEECVVNNGAVLPRLEKKVDHNTETLEYLKKAVGR